MNRNTLIIIVAAVIGLVVLFGLLGKKGDGESGEVTVVTEVEKTSSPKENGAEKLYQQAIRQKESQNMLEAKETYQQIFSQHPDYDKIEVIEKELGDLNMRIVFSNKMEEGRTVLHEVVSGDTLGKLAKKYGTTIDLIKRSNNLKNDIIRIGEKLRIWSAPFNIFVDKSQNILILKQGDEVLKVYDVSTGLNGSTPIGEFTITTRLKDPVWFNRGIVVPPESPENALGTRWLGFDLQGYGIHGTIEPETIGQAVTAGCVRMRNEEVEELYSIIPIGTKVKITE